MKESGISVPQDSVAISWNDFSFTESFLHILFDDLLAWLLSLMVSLELRQPLEAFLVGKSVQRPSKAIHCSREAEVRVG